MRLNYKLIERHPKTLEAYYKTPHWKIFSTSLKEDKSCTCDLCGKPRWTKYKRKETYLPPELFNVHHKHYRSLGREKRDDVLVLCSTCHYFCHLSELQADKNPVYAEMYQLLLDKTPWKFERYDK